MKDNADIRRALDNLQQMVEVLNDRYRDARRERKQLRERIEELLRERELAEVNLAAQREVAEADRDRLATMEERAVTAERRGVQLQAVLDEFERGAGQRDARIAELEAAGGDLVMLRDAVAREQLERSAVEEKLMQAIGKLDAATQAEALARTETAELVVEKNALRRELDAAAGRAAALESELAAAMTGAGAGDAAALAQRDDALRLAHARLEVSEHEHATAVSGLEARLAETDLERERLERRLHEASGERERAERVAESLREQLRSLDSSDDERVVAQRSRIEQLTTDLEAALKKVARREDELTAAAQEMASMENRIISLTTDVEEARAGASSESALAPDEREQIVQQIDSAISMIDRHLAGQAG